MSSNSENSSDSLLLIDPLIKKMLSSKRVKNNAYRLKSLYDIESVEHSFKVQLVTKSSDNNYTKPPDNNNINPPNNSQHESNINVARCNPVVEIMLPESVPVGKSTVSKILNDAPTLEGNEVEKPCTPLILFKQSRFNTKITSTPKGRMKPIFTCSASPIKKEVRKSNFPLKIIPPSVENSPIKIGRPTRSNSRGNDKNFELCSFHQKTIVKSQCMSISVTNNKSSHTLKNYRKRIGTTTTAMSISSSENSDSLESSLEIPNINDETSFQLSRLHSQIQNTDSSDDSSTRSRRINVSFRKGVNPNHDIYKDNDVMRINLPIKKVVNVYNDNIEHHSTTQHSDSSSSSENTNRQNRISHAIGKTNHGVKYQNDNTLNELTAANVDIQQQSISIDKGNDASHSNILVERLESIITDEVGNKEIHTNSRDLGFEADLTEADINNISESVETKSGNNIPSVQTKSGSRTNTKPQPIVPKDHSESRQSKSSSANPVICTTGKNVTLSPFNDIGHHSSTDKPNSITSNRLDHVISESQRVVNDHNENTCKDLAVTNVSVEQYDIAITDDGNIVQPPRQNDLCVEVHTAEADINNSLGKKSRSKKRKCGRSVKIKAKSKLKQNSQSRQSPYTPNVKLQPIITENALESRLSKSTTSTTNLSIHTTDANLIHPSFNYNLRKHTQTDKSHSSSGNSIRNNRIDRTIYSEPNREVNGQKDKTCKDHTLGNISVEQNETVMKACMPNIVQPIVREPGNMVYGDTADVDVTCHNNVATDKPNEFIGTNVLVDLETATTDFENVVQPAVQNDLCIDIDSAEAVINNGSKPVQPTSSNTITGKRKYARRRKRRFFYTLPDELAKIRSKNKSSVNTSDKKTETKRKVRLSYNSNSNVPSLTEGCAMDVEDLNSRNKAVRKGTKMVVTTRDKPQATMTDTTGLRRSTRSPKPLHAYWRCDRPLIPVIWSIDHLDETYDPSIPINVTPEILRSGKTQQLLEKVRDRMVFPPKKSKLMRN